MSDKDSDSESSYRVRQVAPAESVPLFNCVVYLAKTDGGVSARVGNIEGIKVQAENELQALQKIVPQFKITVQQLVEAGEEIPWIDAQREDDEEERLIAIHL